MIDTPVRPASRAQGAASTPERAERERRRRRNPLLWLTAPSLAWYALFTIGPLLGMFVIAFLDWKGLLYTPSFAGLDNFARIFTDPTFFDALRNSAIQVAVAIPVMMPLAFMLGYYLNSKPRGHRVLGVLFFTPGLISISVKAMVFYGVFAPTGGLNGMLEAFGLHGLTTAWLADPATALGTIIFIDLWSGVGWTAVLFAARLASVPHEVLEAADLDGAGQTRKIWQIAFPMVIDYFATLTMLQFLWTLFTSAALILLLTGGGPGTSTTTLSYLVYAKAFSQRDLGYSQAVGIVLLVVGVLGMLLIRRVLRPKI